MQDILNLKSAEEPDEISALDWVEKYGIGETDVAYWKDGKWVSI